MYERVLKLPSFHMLSTCLFAGSASFIDHVFTHIHYIYFYIQCLLLKDIADTKKEKNARYAIYLVKNARYVL